MKKNSSIRLKAAFLLIVFSLNIVLVFACSIGINMGYNKSHHPDEMAAINHNQDESQHMTQKMEVSHKLSMAHSHDTEIADHNQSEKSKNDCCTDEAAQFARMDKMAPKPIDFNLQPAFFAANLSSFRYFNIFSTLETLPYGKYYIRGHHPPIPEIRLAIQSFQV